jgi:hypothetical protein
MAESKNRELIRIERKILANNPFKSWSQVLLYATMILNFVPKKKLPSPFYIVYGIVPRIPFLNIIWASKFASREDELLLIQREREKFSPCLKQ